MIGFHHFILKSMISKGMLVVLRKEEEEEEEKNNMDLVTNAIVFLAILGNGAMV
jgi:hypothetical protein